MFLLNSGNIKSIVGDFVGNYAGSVGWSQSGSSIGGAIYAYKTNIETLVGDFINNYVDEGLEGALGGAAYIIGNITTLTGNFINNHVRSDENYAQAGALYTEKKIESLTGDFIGNYADSGNDGAYAGAFFTYGTVDTLIGDFINNYAKGKTEAYGGAIITQYYNSSYLGLIDVLSGSFIDNYAEAENVANGGAIANAGTINMIADGEGTNGYKKSIVFKGNYVKDTESKRYEAIYQGANASISFASNNGGSYTFYDYTNGDDTGTVTFSGDGDGTINLYNDIIGQANVNFETAYILNMISPSDIHEGTSKTSVIAAKNITISAAIAMAVDVDLENGIMDHFEAENFTNTGSIDVNKIIIVADSTSAAGETTKVPFVVLAKDDEGEPIGTATGLENISTGITEVAGAAYTYTVAYNAETGEFEFTKMKNDDEKKSGEKAAAAVAMAQTSAEAVVSQALNRDLTMTIGLNAGDAEHLSTWVQAFGSDDGVELNNLRGSIDTQFHGIIGGVDSRKFTYRNGLNAVYGVYGAYVGGRQKYDGDKTKLTGGYLGVSVAFRKNEVFSNFTLNGGYLHNEAETAAGTDKFDTKVVAVSDKTGIDLKRCDITLTPAIGLSYMGIDNEDYKTKTGTKIKSKFMNVFTIAPELKLSKDFGLGLDGYAKVAYKMFFYDNNKIRANGVLLSGMSAKPYVEYGFGLKKDWSEEEWNPRDATSYAEVTRHNGGRTGWDLNLGLKLDF